MSGVKISAAEGNDTVFANTADAPCIIGINIDETVNEYIPVIKGLDPCIVDPENAGSIIWGSMIRPPDRTGYADAMIPAVIILICTVARSSSAYCLNLPAALIPPA